MTMFVDTPGRSITSLSIVIISRNEAKNIARAIESVLRALEGYPLSEILLVDSASTDATVEIAMHYPINIVRLRSSWYLSAAAGRYIGTICTKGDFVLFLDGDMELDQEWLDHSLPYIIEHPHVAALSGYWQDVYMISEKIVAEVDCERDEQNRILNVKFINGAMLCRRFALEKVGGFQPFFKSEEEIDFSMRLRYAGFEIVRLPHLICRHYCIPNESLDGILRRFRLNLWLGYGQVPRFYLGTPLFWIYLTEQGQFAVHFAGIIISLVTVLLTLITGKIVFFAGWLLAILAVILAFAIRKRSLRKALLSFTVHTLIIYSSIVGFFIAPRSQAKYPTDVERIKADSHRGDLVQGINIRAEVQSNS